MGKKKETCNVNNFYGNIFFQLYLNLYVPVSNFYVIFSTQFKFTKNQGQKKGLEYFINF